MNKKIWVNSSTKNKKQKKGDMSSKISMSLASCDVFCFFFVYTILPLSPVTAKKKIIIPNIKMANFEHTLGGPHFMSLKPLWTLLKNMPCK